MDSRFLIAAVACVGGALGWTQFERLDRRLADVESRPRVGPVDVAALGVRLERIEEGLTAYHDLVDELRRGGTPGDLDLRLCELEDGLREQAGELHRWREETRDLLTAAVDQGISRLDHSVDAGWRRIASDVASASRLAEENRGGLQALMDREQPDLDLRWRDLMGPAVQLTGASTVGSGVLLDSRPTSTEGEWRTEVLTAWHVVRDILPEAPENDPFVPVRIYHPDGSVQTERARLVEREPGIDVAILVLDSKQRFDQGARLASPKRLECVRVFDRVYAVGCPLGNDPVPTFGEIAETRHHVDGGTYWMVSAPTYIGNSGGGIFDADTHELLGIFSKIYTHGGLRPTVVPHMGLAVPLDLVYDWLASRGLAGLLPPQREESAVESPPRERRTAAIPAPQPALASSQREPEPREPSRE